MCTPRTSIPEVASPLACPRCRVLLVLGHAGGTLLWGCGTCGGIWLDNATAGRITSAMPPDALALADSAAGHARHQPDVHAAIACPECARPLSRRHVGAARVDIDVCEAHGTWFDKHELRHVAQALAVSRAYGRGPGTGAAVAAGAVGAAALGGAMLMSGGLTADPTLGQRVQRGIEQNQEPLADGLEVAADFGAEMDVAGGAEVAMHAGGAALDAAGGAFEAAGGLAEAAGGAAEAAGGAFEVFGVIGEIFGALG